MIKISFIGDIMCEPLMLKAAGKADGSFDFSPVFAHVKDLLAESDYVVGNLETPLAGKQAVYVNELFSFNAPDEFAQAVKAAGVDFVSTANNHCMDRGLEGLKKTIDALDNAGLSHDGTHSQCQENPPFIVDVKGTKISIIPFTYGTNYGMHHVALPEQEYVDLLHSDTDPVYLTKKKGKLSKIKQVIFKPLKTEQIAAIKKALGMEYNYSRKDDYLDKDKVKPYFSRLERKIKKAKEAADLVMFYPHVGGQFNIEPGRFTEYTVEKGLSFGADAIIASHPHIVQKAEISGKVPVFYSIGNFSMSPNSVYLLHENLPEYGLIVHLYIEEGKIKKTTFSVIKMKEEKDSILTVIPVADDEDIVIEDVRKIYNTVTGREMTSVEREFEL